MANVCGKQLKKEDPCIWFVYLAPNSQYPFALIRSFYQLKYQFQLVLVTFSQVIKMLSIALIYQAAGHFLVVIHLYR